MKKLICIPTYNEVNTIADIIEAIFSLDLGFDVMIIDDNSPDGTARLVKKMLNRYPALRLINRKGTRSFAGSYLEGFKYGIQQNYDYIGEMDADFSHNPNALENVNELIKNKQYDFIVGSRYIYGGSTANWGLGRRIISKGGSAYGRIVLNIPIRDLTGGFNFWSSKCLQRIDISKIVSDGYVFQIELKARAFQKGMKYKEFPIVFEDRRVGQSKMRKRIVFEAFYKVILLRLKLLIDK